MSLWHRRLVGSIDDFAIELSFADDPDEGAFAPEAEATSWGAFRLYIKGREPTAAIGPNNEDLQGVWWYWLPLLEWITHNWDPLLHEARFPVPQEGISAADRLFRSSNRLVYSRADWRMPISEFQERHAIITAREGGIFPNIVFTRAGNDIEVSWDDADRPGGGPVRFVQPSGLERVNVSTFAEVWHETLSSALKALSTRTQNQRVITLIEKVKALTQPTPQQQHERYAWLLGLGRSLIETLDGWADLQKRGIKLPNSQPNGLFTLAPTPVAMFASLTPNLTANDITQITSLTEHVRPMSETLRNSVRHAPCPIRDAFKFGHALALDVRAQLGLGSAPVQMDALLSRLNIPVANLSLESATSVRGLSLAMGDASVIACNNSAPQARRPWSKAAILAHELCHILFDRNIGTDLAVASGPWAPLHIEQRANAFAVMFLMPEEGVLEVLENCPNDPREKVRAVAKHFGSSFRATTQHLFSLGLIDEVEREELLEELDESFFE